MSKLVVINLEKGNLNDGFSAVTAQLWDNNSRPTQFTGSLPAAPEIPELYKRFQLIYQALYQRFSRRSQLEIESDLEIEASGLTNVSECDFNDVQQELCTEINAWLNSNSFREIDQQLRARFSLDEEFQILIETNDSLLRRLPWHLWNLFEDYQKAEVALSTPKYERVQPVAKNPPNQVRILAILGNSQGIDIQEDRKVLEQLPNASTVFLVEPSRQELDKWLWDKQGWDILFFAGHSQSFDNTGKIHINRNQSLSIFELKNALKYAIARGLKLAIFNSCDGLGLTGQLADLQIPQTIVMREDVPDIVAHNFLKHFLVAFAGGESFYLAVRYARARLQGLEDDVPGASWLPVICQNPAEEPPTWQELRGKTEKISAPKINKHLQKLFLLSVVVTSLVVGVRSLGIVQPSELSAFDMMMRSRPDEGSDNRLLVVKITEADIQAQKQRQKSSLSDEALQKLLQKLQPYQPRVIGLDIYRDFPVDARYPDLVKRLRQNNNFIAICKVSGGKQQSAGISPPPEIPKSQTGFSDVVSDRDLVIRRQLLALTPDPESLCKTRYSLSLQLASQYLAKQNIQLQISDDGYYQLGSVVFKPLNVPTGGYQQFDAGGHQVLLNYRSSKEIAKQVTLAQVLNGEVNPDWIKDKIVLIGVDAESVKDSFLTPYSTGTRTRQEVPGILIHAQMVSQILGAVLDRRPLLWVWSAWGEVIWIWGWSLVGGIVALYSRSRLQLVIFISVALIPLYVSCYILLLSGGWIPLVPSVVVLVSTAFAVKMYTKFSHE